MKQTKSIEKEKEIAAATVEKADEKMEGAGQNLEGDAVDPAVVVTPVTIVLPQITTTVEPLKDENAQQAERQLLANIERFVTRIRMVAQQIIQQFDDTTPDEKETP